MRYAAAYYLASLSGSTPSAKDIERILASVGIDCDAERAQMIVSAMAGKNIDEVIEEGKSKMGGLMSGGGGAAAPAGGAAAAAAAPEAFRSYSVFNHIASP